MKPILYSIFAMMMAGEAMGQQCIDAQNNTTCPGHQAVTPYPDYSWHLLTITHGGTVTLLKDLTKHQCEFAMHRALRLPATEEEIATEKAASKARTETYEACLAKNGLKRNPLPSTSSTSWGDYWKEEMKAQSLCPYAYGYSSIVSPGDIKSAECFQ